MSYLYNQIVLFGDSITQFSHNTDNKGWGAALQNLYVRKLDVLNRGFSGYNTENAKKLLLHILPKKNNSIKSPKIYLFTIFFGANDAAISPSNQYVPLVKYKENLRQMIKIIKDSDSPYYSPDTRILLIAPPPLFEKDWEKFQEREGKILPRKLETTAKYAQTCVDLANELNIPVLNAWKLFMDKSTKTLTENNHSLSDFFVDGLHLSNLGNETLFNGLLETIRKNWPELDPDNLKNITTLWNDLDYNDPEIFDSFESNIINQLE